MAPTVSENILKTTRKPEEIEMQLKAFLQTLPVGVKGPPPDDFAAQLQWEAWQNHRKELELREAKEGKATQIARERAAGQGLEKDKGLAFEQQGARKTHH